MQFLLPEYIKTYIRENPDCLGNARMATKLRVPNRTLSYWKSNLQNPLLEISEDNWDCLAASSVAYDPRRADWENDKQGSLPLNRNMQNSTSRSYAPLRRGRELEDLETVSCATTSTSYSSPASSTYTNSFDMQRQNLKRLIAGDLDPLKPVVDNILNLPTTIQECFDFPSPKSSTTFSRQRQKFVAPEASAFAVEDNWGSVSRNNPYIPSTQSTLIGSGWNDGISHYGFDNDNARASISTGSLGHSDLMQGQRYSNFPPISLTPQQAQSSQADHAQWGVNDITTSNFSLEYPIDSITPFSSNEATTLDPNLWLSNYPYSSYQAPYFPPTNHYSRDS